MVRFHMPVPVETASSMLGRSCRFGLYLDSLCNLHLCYQRWFHHIPACFGACVDIEDDAKQMQGPSLFKNVALLRFCGTLVRTCSSTSLGADSRVCGLVFLVEIS